MTHMLNPVVGSAASAFRLTTLALTLAACQPAASPPPPPEVIVLPAECTCQSPAPTHSLLAAFAQEYQSLSAKLLARVTASDTTTADIANVKAADFAVRTALHALAAQGRKPQAITVQQAKDALAQLRSAVE